MKPKPLWLEEGLKTNLLWFKGEKGRRGGERRRGGEEEGRERRERGVKPTLLLLLSRSDTQLSCFSFFAAVCASHGVAEEKTMVLGPCDQRAPVALPFLAHRNLSAVCPEVSLFDPSPWGGAVVTIAALLDMVRCGSLSLQRSSLAFLTPTRSKGHSL